MSGSALVYRRLTAPAGLPVEMVRVLRHLRVEDLDSDAVEIELLEEKVAAAVEHLDGRDGILNRALLTQEWEITADRPTATGDGPGFAIDFCPIQAVTGIERLVDGAYLALPAASWRTLARPGERTTVVAAGAGWPEADRVPAAWRLTVRAGYGDGPDAVPAPIRSAILLMVADLYDDRDGKSAASLQENPTIGRLLGRYSQPRA